MNNKISRCRRLRERLSDFAAKYAGWESKWVQDHVAQCPRCQKRFGAIGKVELGLSLLKTEPHGLDLLAKANTKAVGVLKHSLRNSVPAERLRIARVEPGRLEVIAKYGRSVIGTAACFAILILLKVGIFSAMDNIEQQGEKAIAQYYSEHTGQDIG